MSNYQNNTNSEELFKFLYLLPKYIYKTIPISFTLNLYSTKKPLLNDNFSF